MATRINDAARNAAANAVTALLDAGAGPGYIEIRTGAQPASVITVPSGVLLSTLVLSDPAFGAAVGGTASANPITDDVSADATGSAGWFRGFDSTGVAVIDGTITATGGGGDLELNDIDIVADSIVQVNSWKVTMPGG